MQNSPWWSCGRFWDSLCVSCEKGMGWLLRALRQGVGLGEGRPKHRSARRRPHLYLTLDVLEARSLPSLSANIVVLPYIGIYDGHAHGLTGTATGSKGEDLSKLLNLGVTETQGGYYDSVAWKFAGNSKYAAASGVSSIDIEQAPAQVKVNPVTVTYDGQAHPTTAEAYGMDGVDLGPAVMNYTKNTGPVWNTPNAPVDAGLYVAYGYFAGNPDYNYAEGLGEILINPAPAAGGVGPARPPAAPPGPPPPVPLDLVISSVADFYEVEGSAFSNQLVAHFTDPDDSTNPSNYSATIYWGDGGSSVGSITFAGSGTFSVTGSHKYIEENSNWGVCVAVIDGDDGAPGDRTGTSNAVVADAGLTATGVALFTSTENVTFSNQLLATFTDLGGIGDENASDYSAVINWGDMSTGGQSNTTSSISGSHTYTDEGTYTITVQVQHEGMTMATVYDPVKILDEPLTATSLTPPIPASGSSFNGTVFTYTDANTTASTSDFTATITWGDGAVTSGQVVSTGSGGFEVNGIHTYTSTTLTIFEVDVLDDGGAKTKGIFYFDWGTLWQVPDTDVKANVPISCGCGGSALTAMLVPTDPSVNYSSLAANNNPIIDVQYQSSPSDPVPSDLFLTMTFAGQTPAVTEDFSTTGHSAGDTYLLPIQAGQAITSTGRNYYSVDLQITSNGLVSHDLYTGFSNDVVANSVFGAGWTLIPQYGSMTSVASSGSGPAGVLFAYGEEESAFFQQNSDGSFSNPQVHATLSEDGSGDITLADSGNQYQYNSSGQVTSVVAPGSRVMQTFTYSGGNPSTFTDSNGGVYTLAYSSGKVSTVTVPGNANYTFLYASSNLTEVDRPDGSKRTFTYDSNHHMLTDTDGGDTTTYTYNATTGLPASMSSGSSTTDFAPFIASGLNSGTAINASAAAGLVTDPLGNITTSVYDVNDRPLTSTYPDNTSQSWSYDIYGDLSTQTDQLSHTTTFSYTAGTQNVTQINYADGTTQQFLYQTTFNEPTVQIDQLNRRTTMTYDGTTGDLLTSTNPLNQVTTFTYNSLGNISTQTDPLGHITTYTYAADNRHLIAVQDPSGAITSYAYDAGSNQTTVTDINGRVATTLYDTMHRPTVTIDPTGLRTSYTYTSQGWLLSETDPTGMVTSYAYNAQGWQTEEIDAYGTSAVRITTMAYDNNGNVTAVTNPVNQTTNYQYDKLNRQTVVIDPLSRRTTTVYDSAGNDIAQVTTLGRTTFVYDSLNRQIAVEDALGNFTTTVYDAAGEVTNTIDALNRKTTFAYDGAGEQTTVTDPLGRITTTTYNAAGLVSTVTDPLGHTTTYAYDSAERQTTVTDPLGNKTTTTYVATGHNGVDQVSTVTDPLGRTTTYAYDSAGRETTITDPLGHTTTTTYVADGQPGAGQVSTVTDPLGHITTFSYDSSNRQTMVTDPLGRITTIVYTAANQVTAIIDPLGKRTTTIYDAAGRVIAVENALGNFTTTVYDAAGEVTNTIDALNHKTTFAYDGAGDQTVMTDGRGDTTTTVYDADGRVSVVTDGVGTTTYTYDNASEQTVVNTALGRTTTAYDADGEVTSITMPDTKSTTFRYDSAGRVTGSTDYFSNVTTTAYDADGNVTAITDGLNHTTTYAYDAAGQQTMTTDALGNKTTTMYDAAGNVTTTIDADNNRTTFAYDAAGNKTLMTDPLGHTGTYAYDAANQLTSTTDRIGQRVTYAYDSDGREIGETWFNASSTVTNRVTFTYDSAGNMLTAGNTNGAYTMAYNAVNQMTLVNEPVGTTFTMVYDAVGNRTQLQDGTGTEASTYDAEDRLTKRVYTQGATTEVVAVAEGYNALNELTSISRLYGSSETSAGSTSFTYDDAERITNLQHLNGSSGNIANYTYTYDAASNVSTEVRNSTTVTYTYDKTNQLVSQITGLGTTTFNYDATGNRNSTVTGGVTMTYNPTTGNQISTDGTYNYTYDANGNEITKTNIATGDYWTYGYDVKNEMTSAVDQTSGHTIELSATYKYDAFGNRIESDVTQSGTTNTTKFAMDGWDPPLAGSTGNSNWNVAEDIYNGSLKTRYVRGDAVDQLFAELAYNGTSFTPNWTLTDRLGSVRDIVNNTGTSQDSITYNAFGQITSETNSANRGRYAWSGRELDVETGLQYNRARYYDSNTGRWLSQDTLGFSAGDSNLYRYVHNQPTDATDPSGFIGGWGGGGTNGGKNNPISGMPVGYSPYPDLEKKFMDWYAKEKNDMDWIKDIPIPPPQLQFKRIRISAGFGGYFSKMQPVLPPNWDWDSNFAMNFLGYHPNAVYGIRSSDAAPNGSGAQAMYDANGKLITGGLSAGTADKISPVEDFWGHQAADVDPFDCAKKLDNHYGGSKFRRKYIEVRPPNTGNAPINIVD